MLGIMGLKKWPYTLLTLPLPIYTLIYKFAMDRKYKRPLSLLSLRAARDLDVIDEEREKQQAKEGIPPEDLRDAYKNECFKIDWDQIDGICEQVPKVLSALEKSNDEAVPLVQDLKIRPPAALYPIDSFTSPHDLEGGREPGTSGEKAR